MRKLIKVLAVIVFSAACTRDVFIYATCAQVNVPCTCTPGLHGIEGCDHGQTTGQCLCVPAVTPAITITGSPAALSSGSIYTATVNAVTGLNYSWSVSGGTITSEVTLPQVTFTAGNPGVALINVEATNSGGDTAPPAVLAISIVAAPADLKSSDFDVPDTVTEGRAGIPLRVINPDAALTYNWTVDGAGAVDATGAPSHLTVNNLAGTATGALTVHVFATNSVGAASNTKDFLITVVGRQVEAVAGTPKSAPVTGASDGQGSSAQFGGPYDFGDGDAPVGMSLAVSADGSTLYVADISNAILRSVSTANGTVKTIAGSALQFGNTPGIGNNARLNVPIIAATDGATLVVAQTVSSSNTCPLSLATSLTSSSAAIDDIGNCVSFLADSEDADWLDYPITQLAAAPTSDPSTFMIFVVDTFDDVYQLKITNGAYVGSSFNYIFEAYYVTAIAADSTGALYVSDYDTIWKVTGPYAQDTEVDTLDLTSGVATQSGGAKSTIGTPQTYGFAFSNTLTYLTFGPTIGGAYLPGGAVFSSPTASLADGVTLTGVAGPLDAAATTSLDGVGTAAMFTDVKTMALSPNGATLFVADGFQIRQVDTGSGTVSPLAGGVPTDTSGHAHFNSLTAVAIGGDDTVYLADSDTSVIWGLLSDAVTPPTPGGICKLQAISPTGDVSTITGGSCFSPLQNGPVGTATQGFPMSLATGPDGTVYFADWFFSQIRKLTPANLIATAAGSNTFTIASGLYSSDSTAPPIDGFTQSATFYGPTAVASAADGTVAIGDYYYAANADRFIDASGPTVPVTDNYDDGDGDPYGFVRLLSDGQIVTITPPCQIPASSGEFEQYGILGSCMGEVAALGFDAQNGVYALAQTQLRNGDIAPGLYYFAPPGYQPVLVTGHATDCVIAPGNTACDISTDADAPCTPAVEEDCNYACMRQPLLISNAASVTQGLLVAGLAVDPASGDVFFTDQELIRRVHRTPTSCQISIVAGIPGATQVQAGAMPQYNDVSFANLSSLAISPRTLDLYVTDNKENVVLRVRY